MTLYYIIHVFDRFHTVFWKSFQNPLKQSIQIGIKCTDYTESSKGALTIAVHADSQPKTTQSSDVTYLHDQLIYGILKQSATYV